MLTVTAQPHAKGSEMATTKTAYDAGYADGLRGHTDYYRPHPRYTAENRENYSLGYTDGARHAHDAGLPESRRLAALNLPRNQRP
jgi:hypothetical protein